MSQLPTAETADFRVDDHGSILVLAELTDAAREWAAQHLPADRMTWGRYGTVVEPRYIADIVEGIQADGLAVVH